MKKKTIHEVEMPAYQLGNWAWARMQDLMDNGLASREQIDPEDVNEAECLLQFKRAIAERADAIVIKLFYENPPAVAVD
jgi:hypothetical protein